MGLMVLRRGQAQVVALPIERVAEFRQAEYFLAMLDDQKAKVCDRWEAQLDAVARPECADNQFKVRRRRRGVNALESELRMIDHMRHALRVRLGLPTLAPGLRTAVSMKPPQVCQPCRHPGRHSRTSSAPLIASWDERSGPVR